MSVLTFRKPKQVVFPQFNNQPVVIEYGEELYSLLRGDGNTYLIKNEGDVMSVLNMEDEDISEYSNEDAVWAFIQFVFLGVKFNGNGVKGKAFIDDADHDSISDAQQLRVANAILRDHESLIEF